MYVTIPLDHLIETTVCAQVTEKKDHLNDDAPTVDKATGLVVHQVWIWMPATLPTDTAGPLAVDVVGRPDIDPGDTIRLENFHGVIYQFTGRAKNGFARERDGVTFKAAAVHRVTAGTEPAEQPTTA
jgi:hypothetical protein